MNVTDGMNSFASTWFLLEMSMLLVVIKVTFILRNTTLWEQIIDLQQQ